MDLDVVRWQALPAYGGHRQPVGTRLQIDRQPGYPGIVKDFEHSFAMVAELPCDIALGPHPAMVDFWGRVARREQGNADALIDPTLCRAYAKDARESFEAQLAKQRAAADVKMGLGR